MKKIFILGLIVLFGLLMWQCSTDKNPLPSTAHPEGWNTADAENFHGTKVLESGYTSCKACHGADLNGGKTGLSCFQCHQTYPHPASWILVDNEKNHAAYIANNSNAISFCRSCHGSDLTGGKSDVSCYDCHQAGSVPF
ncbi:MAG: hypothetical protein GXO74_15155 [Calditrichaeota bacterium]|nr:hypothetical protein [Calditrichota bacterium]